MLTQAPAAGLRTIAAELRQPHAPSCSGSFACAQFGGRRAPRFILPKRNIYPTTRCRSSFVVASSSDGHPWTLRDAALGIGTALVLTLGVCQLTGQFNKLCYESLLRVCSRWLPGSHLTRSSMLNEAAILNACATATPRSPSALFFVSVIGRQSAVQVAQSSDLCSCTPLEESACISVRC